MAFGVCGKKSVGDALENGPFEVLTSVSAALVGSILLRLTARTVAVPTDAIERLKVSRDIAGSVGSLGRRVI